MPSIFFNQRYFGNPINNMGNVNFGSNQNDGGKSLADSEGAKNNF